jgi:predicted short-subunit dehydrogenase-like oxidoreductase (DUF2520 family)
LLCVRDEQIADVARSIPDGPIVAHCAGALGLEVLGPREGFSLHPLLSVTVETQSFRDAACAIDGTSDATRAEARRIAAALGMDPIVIGASDRALYHAAASMASNFLVALEAAAASVAAPLGVERRHVARLAESALANWTRMGDTALTGPIARGDEATVSGQRTAIAHQAPRFLRLWDAMADATRQLVP